MESYKPALTPEEIVEVAEKYSMRYVRSGCSPDDVEEVKGVFALGMVEATTKAEAGKAVRAYQWSYALNRVKAFWAMRHDHVAPQGRVEVALVEVEGQVEVERKARPEEEQEAAVCVGLDAGEVGCSWADTLPANTPGPVDALEPESYQVQVMRVCLSKLPARLAEVLRLRYLDGATLEEVGKAWGVTREAVRQAEVKALAEMRRMMEVA